MGAPIATPSDLQTYLGLATIDNDRATLILELAQNLCEAILSPLPASANAVVLGMAARAFTNAGQLSSAALGSGHLQYATNGAGAAIGGLYLSRADKTNLRRLAGSGGAFSIDPLPKGSAAVQAVTLGGSPTGGTFKLSFVNQATAALAFDASAATVQAAIEALNAIGPGNVSVAGGAGGPWVLTFTGTLATTPVPTLGGDPSGLTGTSPSVVVTVVAKGVLGAGQGLPPWDFDYYDFGSAQYVPGGFL